MGSQTPDVGTLAVGKKLQEVAQRVKSELALTGGPLPERMRGMSMGGKRWLLGASVVLLLLAAPRRVSGQEAQQQTQPSKKKEEAPSPANRLTIEVTGGETNKPVENASVYVKTVEQHLLKDKKFEVNVKTNQHGIAHVPDAPVGRVLIQIVADGWKTYGRWHDITDPKQVIKIHLDPPPRWY